MTKVLVACVCFTLNVSIKIWFAAKFGSAPVAASPFGSDARRDDYGLLCQVRQVEVR